MTTWTLTGNTFAAKDEIKAIGGRWDADKKAWTVSASTMSEKSSKSAAVYGLRKRGITVTQH